MRESAQAALTYIRSRCKELGLKPDFYEDLDLHLHVPSGAIPKDGPSAGVTICCAMVSALTGTPLIENLAMTGEITLTGKVLAIGGLKEKTLAALRSGMTTILVPEQNKKDISEIPKKIRRRLEIKTVDHADEVIAQAFAKPPKKAKPVRKTTKAAAAKKAGSTKKTGTAKKTGSAKKAE